MILGFKGIPFEEQVISICRLCPAGALEAGRAVFRAKRAGGQRLDDELVQDRDPCWPSRHRRVFIHRPWCRIFCPLGGLLALFNRFSLFHLRFKPSECVECNLCRSRCPMGVKVDQKVNVSGCIRCLECSTCGAVTPSFALPKREAGQRK